MQLDLEFVRSQFPAFALPEMQGQAFFENAGGSFACRQTIDALHRYYTETKVQPYANYPQSSSAGDQMDASHQRWAEALGVTANEVSFGPSTSQNTYVLAHAFGEILSAGDEVVVTNQDHEANTGAVRRMADRVGATVKEWRTDQSTGLLDLNTLAPLLTERTRLMTFPHCSNIIGQENDAAAITAMAHAVGARVIVDGVSFAPHTIPDVGAIGCDVYLFSLYKTYSVHQGLMAIRQSLITELPNQSHYFNADYPHKRFTPAGPDHAQVAAAGAVLEYIEAIDHHHADEQAGPDNGASDLRAASARVSALWRDHEDSLVVPVLEKLAADSRVRLLGPASIDAAPGHRCPTVAFTPLAAEPLHVADRLTAQGIMCSAGDFYANRVLEGLDVDPARGVVRVSWVHYTSPGDIDRLLNALDTALA